MRSKKNLKIVTLICTLVILFSNILPSLSLATNEILDLINKQENMDETELNEEIEQSEEKIKNTEDDINQAEISKVAEERQNEENKENETQKDKISEIFIMQESETVSQTGLTYSSDRIEVQNLPTYLQTTVNNDEFGEGIYSKRVSVNGNDYREAFCIQCGVNLYDGTFSGSEVDGKTYKDDDLTDAYKVAYVGWYETYGDRNIIPGQSDYRAVSKVYAFTQQLIWEKLKQSPGTFLDSSIQTEYNTWKANVNTRISKMDNAVPSFAGDTITLEVNKKYKLTDSDGHLEDYPAVNKTVDGIKFEHTKGSNDLYITVTDTCKSENYTFKSESIGLYLHYGGSTSKVYIINNDLQRTAYTNYYPVDPFFRLRLNIKLNGGLTIKKVNSNGDLLAGCTFRIWNEDTGYSNSQITSVAGTIVLEDLKAGEYHVQETSASTGYLLNNTIYDVEVKPGEKAEVNILTVTNQEPTGEIQIHKIDQDTGNGDRVDKTSHHGEATLKGAEYTLYAKEDIYNVARTVKYFSQNDEIATFIFSEHGVASIKIINTSTPAQLNINGSTLTGLPMGNFYSTETKVPTGYTKDNNIYDYILSYKDAETPIIKIDGTVRNIVQKAPFEVIKVSTNNNTTAETVANAEFTAILTKYVDYYGSFDEAKKHLDEFAEDEYSIFRTGANGHGISCPLAYGEYTVNETYTPSPEILTVGEFYVTIDRDSQTPIKELVENDLPFQAYIKLQKQDKTTGKFVTYSNATFELYKLNEDENKWEQVQCKVGDNYFKSWTTNNEGIAKTETKLDAGNYKLSEVKIPTGFIELDGELTFKVDNRNSTLDYDKDWDAWITVTVENSQPKGILKLNKKVALREDIDKTMIKDIDFTKISFELVTDDTVIDYADGATIYEKGTVVGKYNLKEDGTLTIVDLPMGKYHLKELTTIDGAVLDETEHKVAFEQKDTITKEYIIETDIENNTTAIEISKKDITGQEELIGAKLTVLDENEKIIDRWISAEKTHKIEGLLVGKNYILREEIAPESFVKATSIKFTVENTADIQKVVMIDKIVEVTKIDLVTGEELEGAELQVVDEDGNVIDEWISKKEPHKVIGLEENKNYKLIEITSPYGFEIAEEISFTVTEDKETQKIEMKDMPILTDIQLVKVDSETKEVIKAKFKFGLYEDDVCTKLIKEFESDKNTGTITFDSLRYGTVFVKELSSPKGYTLSDKVIKIEVNDQGVLVDSNKIEEKDNIYSFKFENEKAPEIQTGNETNYILLSILAVTSLIGMMVGIIIVKNKEKSKN